MATRTEKRALAAIEKLYKENPSVEKGSVVWLPLELGDFDSIVKSAQIFLQKEQRLDILGRYLCKSVQTRKSDLLITVDS